MNYIYHIALLSAVAMSLLLSSCGKDFQDDIDKLNATHTSVEQRVSTLEAKATSLNTQFTQLSALANAVEQNFYITDVKTTDDGYELKMSNGHTIVLQTMPDGLLTPMPAIAMTQISGLFYWTMNGMLFTGADGTPIHATGQKPMVKYDYKLQQWLISIDGGITFKDINTYVSIFINDQVLKQVINNYVSQNSTTIFNQQMLYQVISTYIQQNYKDVFSINILNEVVSNYVNERYTRLFDYQLLEKIFSQYNYEYVTSNIKVDELVSVIVSFINEHNEIFENNEVLYEILTAYMTENKTTIFSEDILLTVINNFIENNQNYINVELLTQVVCNYIDVNRDVVFNTETIRNMLTEYVKKYYVQVFSQNILIQIVSTYVTQNKTTIFNEKLIHEIVNNCVQNNYTTIFKQDTIIEIVNNYIKTNTTTVFNRDVLIEVIRNYFQKNYNIFIKVEDISTAINNYISKSQTTIIDVDIVRSIIYNYLEIYYKEVFSYDLVTQLVYSYFTSHKEVFTKYISQGTAVVTDVKVSDEECVVTLANGQTVRLVVYNAMARLRQRVQSLVAVPDSSWKSINQYQLSRLNYLVSPASMSHVIKKKHDSKEVTIELIGTNGNGRIDTLEVYESMGNDNGMLQVGTYINLNEVKAIALHIKENKVGGTDIMTEFTVVSEEKQPGYLKCPNDHHPHMINLGLPSGTLWSCCNVGASKPEEYGSYFAWGETWTKDDYSLKSYVYCGDDFQSFQDIGSDIAGTNYDAAYTKWKESWRMPTRDQLKELCENCTATWVTQGNTSGTRFTGANGGAIFLPAAGWQYGNDNWVLGTNGYYWSSMLTPMPNAAVSYIAVILSFDKGGATVAEGSDMGFRFTGLPVRPVTKP